MKDQNFYDLGAALTAVLVVTLGIAMVDSGPIGPPIDGEAVHVTYVNLTVSINATTGWPQYTPANFSVSEGRVVLTIVDHDAPMNWSACDCRVAGTVGSVEYVNGTPETEVGSANVAHTFSVGPLGINILSPGASVVTATLELDQTGTFEWNCLAPCGAGSDPYDSPPMGAAGYMSGTMTVE
jgi:hypothetical protein